MNPFTRSCFYFSVVRSASLARRPLAPSLSRWARESGFEPLSGTKRGARCLLNDAIEAFFNLARRWAKRRAKRWAKLIASRKTATCIAVLSSHPCNDAVR